jgi:ATP adenylyltransferase
MSLYCFANARTPEQLAEMQSLEARGVCLFCPDGLRQHERQQVLARTRHWSVTPNEFPYRGTTLHLLLVPDEHAADLLDLQSDVRQDFWTALAWVRDRYRLSHYGLGVRNGDCRFTGATIRHVHVHLLVSRAPVAGEPPVRMRFSGHPARPAPSPCPPGSG